MTRIFIGHRSLFTPQELAETVSADEFYAFEWAAEQQRLSEQQQASEDYWEAQTAKAEYEAEMANERWFEDRGYDEARFQEDMEAKMGVQSFADAMAEAYR